MTATIAFSPKRTLEYVEGGGHLWVFLNWALALRAVGCCVYWLEVVKPRVPRQELPDRVARLRRCLDYYDLGDSLVLYTDDGSLLPDSIAADSGKLEEVRDRTDLLLNLRYDLPRTVSDRFRRSALIDIDPGLTQLWISEGQLDLAPHDTYYTIGETVGVPGSSVPDCGLTWHYTPPPVYLPAWPVSPSHEDASFTTVTHWGGQSVRIAGEEYPNGKREGFLPYLDLPQRTAAPLELATWLWGYEPERQELNDHGWSIVESREVADSPWDYQRYIQASRGEFSCAKPSCVKLQNAWVSDRTLCYLASGKPAIVEHTGPSRYLPDRDGLLRFRSLEEAQACLESVAEHYDRHSRAARALVETTFDGVSVVKCLLEVAL